ncbi:MAG: hypothetical protein V9F04_08080 [Dermatophilaceae bacterium]
MMVQRQGLAGWVAMDVAALVAVVVTGCTSGDSAAPPTSALPSTSAVVTTTTPSPSTSTISDQGLAVAGAWRYYDEFNKALTSLDTKVLRSTFAGCRICGEDADRIDQAKAAGWRFEQAVFDLKNVSVTSQPDATHILVRGLLASPPLVVRNASGGVVHSSAGASGYKDFVMVRSGEAWLVQALS